MRILQQQLKQHGNEDADEGEQLGKLSQENQKLRADLEQMKYELDMRTQQLPQAKEGSKLAPAKLPFSSETSRIFNQPSCLQWLKNTFAEHIESFGIAEERNWKRFDSLLLDCNLRLERLSKTALLWRNKQKLNIKLRKPLKLDVQEEQQGDLSELFREQKNSSVSFISSSRDEFLPQSNEEYLDIADIQNEYQEALSYIEELQEKNNNIANMVNQHMMQCRKEFDSLEKKAFSRLQLQIDLLDDFIVKLEKSMRKIK